MERNNEIGMLDLMARPAFCAAGGRITRVNAQAAAYDLAPGMAITDLLLTGAEEYAAFEDGCLYLTLSAGNRQLGASVFRVEDCQVFCLEETEDNRELQAMALAARELRNPLNTVMSIVGNMFPVVGLQENPAARKKAAQLNKGLLQILRVINNMSDAEQPVSSSRMEMLNLPGVFDEIFEKAAALVAHTEVTLHYQGCPETVYGLADRDSLARAVLNMVSNAVKFAHPGDTIRATLTRRGQKLYLSLEDNGDPIPPGIRGELFTRYRRTCTAEESRFGIGLGLVLIRAVAAAHGGTVLIDRHSGPGNRVTMSLTIRQGNSQVKTGLCCVDTTGGWDRFSVELSGLLPDSLYEKEI